MTKDKRENKKKRKTICKKLNSLDRAEKDSSKNVGGTTGVLVLEDQ